MRHFFNDIYWFCAISLERTCRKQTNHVTTILIDEKTNIQLVNKHRLIFVRIMTYELYLMMVNICSMRSYQELLYWFINIRRVMKALSCLWGNSYDNVWLYRHSLYHVTSVWQCDNQDHRCNIVAYGYATSDFS